MAGHFIFSATVVLCLDYVRQNPALYHHHATVRKRRTPYCVTINFDTLGENPALLDTITVRNRDTGEQERIAITELVNDLKL